MTKSRDASGEDPAVVQGMVAYAHRQSYIREAMLVHCEEAWRFVDEYLERGLGLPEGNVFLIECH